MNTVSDFIRWSPHSDSEKQQFMTISAREAHVSLYNVTHFRNDALENIRFERVFKKEKIPHIKCFDWSPLEPDLVAVGKSGGEALILRMKNGDNGDNSVSLPVKHQRGCNSLAFSRVGMLAVGLDKVRNDFCLNVWDLNSQSSSGSIRADISTSARETTFSVNQPQRQLAPSEMVSAIQFFVDQPHVLIAGVGQRFLRAFDLRENSGPPAFNFPTRMVHGITIDKSQNYFSSCSEDGYMAIWDRRFAGSAAQEPVLQFPKIQDAAGGSRTSLTIHSLRYARENLGSFGVLGTNGGLRLYQLGCEDQPMSTSGDPASVTSSGRNLYPSHQAPASTIEKIPSENLFVSRTSEVKRGPKNENFTSFDWISDGGASPALRVISLTVNGVISGHSVPTIPIESSFGPRNNFLVSDTISLNVLSEPSTRIVSIAEPNHTMRLTENTTPCFDDDASNTSFYEEIPKPFESRPRQDSILDPEDFMFDPRDILRIDISVTMRRRAEQGYQFDCSKNEKLSRISKKDTELGEMWRWLDGAVECARGEGMQSNGLDLSYLGVLGIWKPSLPTSRLDSSNSFSDGLFHSALKTINEANKRKGIFKFSGSTNFLEQRTLGLAMCGWSFDSDTELEAELLKFEKQGQFEKAAGWALFHGNIERCIKSLSMGKTEMKLMSTAVAGYNSQRQAGGKSELPENTIWKDLCRELATHMDDPYSRAIFAFVSNGDWQDVLDGSTGLPIRERLGIALRFLDDDALSTYIDDFTTIVIRDGEPEGILLTGVTEKAMDLLQVYVNKTSDVQTAAIVASFAVPRFFSDSRADLWVESYRDMLDRWKFFHARAAFDIKRRELATSRKGACLLEPLPRQIYMRCNFCDRKVAHRSDITASRSKGVPPIGVPTQASFSQKGTVCPNCHKPLPRCAICLLHLGSPNMGLSLVASTTSTIDEANYNRWFNFCLICNHGSHAGHAKEWFSKHTLCPVPECECLCGVYRYN